jgi:DNA invertase Pin-like site-specific DNA recombinase
MTTIGYARVSTKRQSLDQQLDALNAAGCEKIFTDKRSGARTDRAGLDALLDYARPGDTVIVWKLDRLGRSLSHVVQTAEALHKRGINIRGLTDGVDYSTPVGKMLAGILAALAEYERGLIAERAEAARDAARARGRHVGRPKALTADQARQLRALHASGESVADLCRSFGISRATAYRVLDSPEVAVSA